MKLSDHDQEQLIPALRVLIEPTRFRILCGLGLTCRPVTEIVQALGLGQTNVSFHLRVLREAGFVRAERRGAFIYYCLADTAVLRILQDLKEWVDARQVPIDSEIHPRRPSVKRHAAAVKTKEVA